MTDDADLYDELARVGVEIELLAPPGVDRRRVAEAIGERVGGGIRPTWGRSTEPRPGGGPRSLYNLSRGWSVHRADGEKICHLVDDMTIRDGMSDGFSDDDYRIVTDDKRLARLISLQADPTAPIDEVLQPVVALFEGHIRATADGRRQMAFADGRSLATALLQIVDRPRVCEIVTTVIDHDLGPRLAELLEPARDLGCVVPTEAAVHAHFDAGPFRRADRFADLVTLFSSRNDELKERFGTNPACRYLGPLPEPLVKLVGTPGFRTRSWKEVEELTKKMEFKKLLDLNLLNLRQRTPGKDTVEVRIFPGGIDADPISAQIEDMRRILSGRS